MLVRVTLFCYNTGYPKITGYPLNGRFLRIFQDENPDSNVEAAIDFKQKMIISHE